MFDFTVKYFGFLKHVPLFPHVFDTMLKVRTFVSNRVVLDHLDDIETEVLSWDQTSMHLHKFGGTQFNFKDKEIGHIHGNGLLDVPFSKVIKEQLIAETNGRVKEHHVFKKSGWISFHIQNALDKKLAIEILMRSYEEKSFK